MSTFYVTGVVPILPGFFSGFIFNETTFSMSFKSCHVVFLVYLNDLHHSTATLTEIHEKLKLKEEH